MTNRKIRIEIILVLGITFGMSGIRSALRLIDALLKPQPLNEQSVALNASQAQNQWIDCALQLCSSATLFLWGGLALYLLGPLFPKITLKDFGWGAGLAALIGLPGLFFYVSAVHLGLSKRVIPAPLDGFWWEIPVLLINSGANAFAEEVVVVLWFITRLKQLNLSTPAAIMSSAFLRGLYHLYQGVSAGFGNLIMGVLFGWFFHKTGRVWPLIIGHFLIDSVAFVGFTAVGGNLSWLGI